MTITAIQRRKIREQSGHCCEYCRISENGRLARFHVDHIIAIKHGGIDTDNNLCLSCPKCNAYKGSNVAALDPKTGEATKLYHPRNQRWDLHFRIHSDATLTGLTPEGRTTIAVLKINDDERVQQRFEGIESGDYPCKKG